MNTTVNKELPFLSPIIRTGVKKHRERNVRTRKGPTQDRSRLHRAVWLPHCSGGCTVLSKTHTATGPCCLPKYGPTFLLRPSSESWTLALFSKGTDALNQFPTGARNSGSQTHPRNKGCSENCWPAGQQHRSANRKEDTLFI